MEHALWREALSLVERDIATPEDIDNVVRYGFGFRYVAAGPFLQRDHGGLDVHLASAGTIYPDLCNSRDPSPFLTLLVQAGCIGMKAKIGFYEWTDESIVAERARYDGALLAAKSILDNEASILAGRAILDNQATRLGERGAIDSEHKGTDE